MANPIEISGLAHRVQAHDRSFSNGTYSGTMVNFVLEPDRETKGKYTDLPDLVPVWIFSTTTTSNFENEWVKAGGKYKSGKGFSANWVYIKSFDSYLKAKKTRWYEIVIAALIVLTILTFLFVQFRQHLWGY